jgi:hypothetical protein
LLLLFSAPIAPIADGKLKKQTLEGINNSAVLLRRVCIPAFRQNLIAEGSPALFVGKPIQIRLHAGAGVSIDQFLMPIQYVVIDDLPNLNSR